MTRGPTFLAEWLSPNWGICGRNSAPAFAEPPEVPVRKMLSLAVAGSGRTSRGLYVPVSAKRVASFPSRSSKSHRDPPDKFSCGHGRLSSWLRVERAR